MFIVPPSARCYRPAMPIEWTISHGSRLVVAVAKGEMRPEHMRDFLQAIDQAGARPYGKMIDIKGLATSFAPEQIGAFAALVREREADSVVGPIAIVVGVGPLAQQARAFSERGCVNCHGAPGVNWAKFSEGLRPDPPDLKELVDELRPQELFWVVKHGIHMTGMPSFGLIEMPDREIWTIVAFVKKLPSVTDDEFKAWTSR